MTATALERCVGDVHRFAEDAWGRRPQLHHAGPEAFAGLLDLGDVDHLVTETLLRMPGFRLVKDGEPLDPASYTQTVRVGSRPLDRTARPDRVLDAFADGTTIVLQALHRQSGAVARLCRELELELTHPVQANAYVTPPTAKGFAVHHDTHDVFVLQTGGHKAWRVYAPLVELAGAEQPWRDDLGDPGEPVLEAELGPGDVLYIPRGFPHDAEARREVSIHVTVGILSFTWLDLWRALFRRDAAAHLPFREPLPMGFADDTSALGPELEVRRKELLDWLEGSASDARLEEFAARFWSSRRPVVHGQLEQIAALDEIGPERSVRRRSTGVFRLERDRDRVRLVLGLRELRLPSFCEPALRWIAAADGEFRVDDLPGLDGGSRVVLARRLVREGALEVPRAGA